MNYMYRPFVQLLHPSLLPKAECNKAPSLWETDYFSQVAPWKREIPNLWNRINETRVRTPTACSANQELINKNTITAKGLFQMLNLLPDTLAMGSQDLPAYVPSLPDEDTKNHDGVGRTSATRLRPAVPACIHAPILHFLFQRILSCP